MQMKIMIFLGTALFVDGAVPKVDRRFKGTGQGGRFQFHMAHFHTKTEKENAQKSTEQCQSCGTSISWERSMRVCHGCLQ